MDLFKRIEIININTPEEITLVEAIEDAIWQLPNQINNDYIKTIN